MLKELSFFIMAVTGLVACQSLSHTFMVFQNYLQMVSWGSF